MKRITHERYVEKCSKAKQDALDKETFDGLDDGSYEKAVEGLEEDAPEKLEGAEQDEEPAEGGEGDDEGEEGEGEEPVQKCSKCGMKKSLCGCEHETLDIRPTEEELLKSMELLATSGQGSAEQRQRRATLARKVAAGETLTKSEADELQAPPAPAAEQPLSKALEGDDAIQAAYDGSEFLQVFGERVTSAVDGLQKSLLAEKTDNQQFRRRLATGLDAFAKAVVEGQQEMRKSLRAVRRELARVAGAPLPWAGRTQIQPSQMQRSPRDGAPLAELGKAGELKKSQATAALGRLLEKSYADGKDDLGSSYGDVLARMESNSGDWRRTTGLTPDIALEIAREANGQ